MQFLSIHDGVAQPLDSAPGRLPAGGVLWIDCHYDEARAWVPVVEALTGATVFEDHLLDAENPEHPSYFDSTRHYEMVVFRGLALRTPAAGEAASTRVRTRPTVFFVLPGCLVTVRAADSRTVATLRARLLDPAASRQRLPRSAEELMLRLLNGMVDRYLELRQPLTEQLERWQRRLLDPRRPFRDWYALLEARGELRKLEQLCEEQLDAMQEWLDERMELAPGGSGGSPGPGAAPSGASEGPPGAARGQPEPGKAGHPAAAVPMAAVPAADVPEADVPTADVPTAVVPAAVVPAADAPAAGDPAPADSLGPLPDALQVRANDVVNHIHRVLAHARRLQDSIESAVQLHFSSTAHRTNEIMRTLTTISAVFMPLTLITGIFGMNFEFIPGLHMRAGFWIAIAVMGLIAVALLVWFRTRRYLASPTLGTRPRRAHDERPAGPAAGPDA